MGRTDSFVDDNLGRYFCSPQDLDKALNSLSGLIEGVLADGILRDLEVEALKEWLNLHVEFHNQHPFSEFVEELFRGIEEEKIDGEVLEDILWVCKQFRSENSFYDESTASIHELQGICQGILADGVISKDELESLQVWLADHEELKKTWPYEGLCSLIVAVLADGVIDDDEHRMLKRFFWEFVETDKKKVIYNPPAKIDGKLRGVCSLCPDIEFPGKVFSFTGKSSTAPRSEIVKVVNEAGATFSKGVTKKVDYLIIGNEGNPHWAFSCYGRKVEQAVKLRKAGGSILLVHENDFWDALADEGIVDRVD